MEPFGASWSYFAQIGISLTKLEKNEPSLRKLELIEASWSQRIILSLVKPVGSSWTQLEQVDEIITN